MIYYEGFVFWPTISSIPLPEAEGSGNLHGHDDLMLASCDLNLKTGGGKPENSID